MGEDAQQKSAQTSAQTVPEQRILAHSHYGVLQVSMTASIAEIRRAYRELSKLYHPDTTNLPATYATAKFRRLNEAYHVLNTLESRQAYDRQLSQSTLLQMAVPKVSPKPPPRPSSAYLDPNDRPLSPGEIFALFILALSLAACLAIAIVIGILRGDTPRYSTVSYQPHDRSASIVRHDLSPGNKFPTITTDLSHPTPNTQHPNSPHPTNQQPTPNNNHDNPNR